MCHGTVPRVTRGVKRRTASRRGVSPEAYTDTHEQGPRPNRRTDDIMEKHEIREDQKKKGKRVPTPESESACGARPLPSQDGHRETS